MMMERVCQDLDLLKFVDLGLTLDVGFRFYINRLIELEAIALA